MELDVWAGDWGIPSVDPACLAVQAYCKFSKVPVDVKSSHNPWKSSTGSFPVFRHEQKIITEVNEIFTYLREQNFGCEFDLSIVESGDMLAFIAMISEKLAPAIEHLCWCNAKNFSEIVRPWYGRAVGLPFSLYYPNKFRDSFKSKIYDCYPNLSEDDVETKIYKDARECMNHLSSKLNNSDFFFGNQPTALDAIVYGYLALLLKAPFQHNSLSGHLKATDNLQAHVRRIQLRYFSKEVEKLCKDKEETDEEIRLNLEEFPNKKRNIALSALFAIAVMVGYAVMNGIIQIEINRVPDDSDQDNQESDASE